MIVFKYIKRFFTDFWHLEKHIFFGKYFLLPAIIFFFWAFVGNVSNMMLKETDLIQVRGTVTAIEEVTIMERDKLFYKELHRELRISVKNYPGYFRIYDSLVYKPIIYNINKGDFVYLLHRNECQTMLSMGQQNDIYVLYSKGREFKSLDQIKTSSMGIIFITGIFSIVFSGLYIYWIKIGVITYKLAETVKAEISNEDNS